MPLGMEGFCAILFYQFSVFYTMGLRIAALRFLPLLVFAVRTFVEDHFRIAFEGEDVRGDTIEAIRSYEKAGFRREGLLRDDVCIEGDYRDIVWMAAVNSGNDQENEE